MHYIAKQCSEHTKDNFVYGDYLIISEKAGIDQDYYKIKKLLCLELSEIVYS